AFTVEQPVLHQPLGADELLGAGEGAERAVRGAAVARRPDRQHLPPPLSGGREEIDEAARARVELTGRQRAGQTGRMAEHTGAAVAEPGKRHGMMNLGPLSAHHGREYEARLLRL